MIQPALLSTAAGDRPLAGLRRPAKVAEAQTAVRRDGVLDRRQRREVFGRARPSGRVDVEALADARWGAETGMFGNYLGPHTVRFNNLKISG